MKTCTKCDEAKELSEFYKNSRAKDGRRTDCKRCVLEARRRRYEEDGEILRERVRSYRERYPDRIAAYRQSPERKEHVRQYGRRRNLELTYGISLDEYNQMFQDQDSRCAVCRSDDPGRYWTVDHDHLTGVVRGILCWHCNVGLGHFRDDISALVAAADYLIHSHTDQPAAR